MMTLSPLAITFTGIGSLEFLDFLHEFKGPPLMKNNEAPFSRENLVLANDSNYPRIRVSVVIVKMTSLFFGRSALIV